MRFAVNTILFAFLVLIPFRAHSEDLGSIRLSLIEGDVQAFIQDTADWSAATVNLPLNEGDRLWAPENSRAELQIRGGVYVRADADTALDILTSSNDSAQFYLDRGHVYINNRRGGIQTVQIDTPQSSIRSYDNSIMLVDVTEDGLVEISMLKGFAYAESRAGATRVSAGNTLTIRGENNAEIAPISSPDEWEQWNTERDRHLTAWSDSSRYLPDELHEYSADLDENGRWDYVSDYGYVWRPTIVAADWAPYTVGNWIWIRGHYVWIAHDPWCWVPSHYGRWVYITSSGWSWVPPTMGAAYWAPGYVGWVVTTDYVAWVPLAPGEIYYGYGYYGPWSRNIATINVNTVVVNRTYVNARANNSVVVVRRDSFGTGRRNPVRISENPFVDTQRQRRENLVVAPPQIKPQQPIVIAPEKRDPVTRRPPERERVRPETTETRQVIPAVPSPQPARRPERPVAPPSPPAVQQQPSVQQTLPPERYRRIRPQEMKNDRRVVREREASVFRPQPPDNLTVRKLNEPRVIPRKPAQQPQKRKAEEGTEGRKERQPGR
jgi:uncharacterized protein DUF6600/FecR-like protein